MAQSSYCKNCLKLQLQDGQYICTCVQNSDQDLKKISEEPPSDPEVKFSGTKIEVPDGFSFRNCIKCNMKTFRGYPEDLCKECQNHQAFHCTCPEEKEDPEDLRKCNLCLQIHFFKVWPRSWKFFYERRFPKFYFLPCDNCVTQRYLFRHKPGSFKACENCQKGETGVCTSPDPLACKSCPHCDQYADYLQLIEGQEYGCPF